MSFRRRSVRTIVFVVGAAALGIVVALLVNEHVVRDETKSAHADVGRLLQLRDGTLQVRVDGPRASPPIVLIHRFASSLHEWDAVVPILSRDYRVVRVDLLGHGGSAEPRNGYSIDNEARLVAEALRTLHVIHAVVIGHSMGGAIAVALAERDPKIVARLVVMDSNDRTRYFNLPLLSRWAPRRLLGPALWTVVPDGMIRNGLEVLYAPGFRVPDRDVHDVRRMTYASYTGSLSGFLRYLDQRGLDRRLAQLRIPRMVVWGAHDRLVDEQAVALYRRVRGLRIVVMQRSGHSPLVEEPRRTAAVLLRFARERG